MQSFSACFMKFCLALNSYKMRKSDMDKEYIIDEMHSEDAAQAAAIEADIFSMPWSEHGFCTSILSPDTLYLCVRDGENMIAYCGLLQSFEEADITNVAVRSEYRSQGIGRAMLEALMEGGKKRGITRFTLEVRVSNEAALHLYESLGFVSAGIRKNFYERPKEDAVIMWKE